MQHPSSQAIHPIHLATKPYCATVGLADTTAVTSANVVGYQYVPVTSGAHLITPTFKNVTDSTSKFDLTDVTAYRSSDGTTAGTPTAFGSGATTRCNGAISIQVMDSKGYYSADVYKYYTTSAKPDGWYLGTSSSTKIGKGVVTLEKGQAIFLNNTYKTTQAVFLQFNGEVDVTCENVIPGGASLFGNSTPVAIDLSEIKMWRIVDGVKTEFGTGATTRCNGAISLQVMDSKGYYSADVYKYYTTSAKPDGWYLGTSSTTKIGKGVIVLQPGDAIFINNTYKSGQNVIMELPKPISE